MSTLEKLNALKTGKLTAVQYIKNFIKKMIGNVEILDRSGVTKAFRFLKKTPMIYSPITAIKLYTRFL